MSMASLSGASLSAHHRAFEAALPSMDDVIRFQFRKWPRRLRADARADARAACWHCWSGLIRRGKDPLIIGPTGIAANAARYVKNGRQLGCGASGRGAMDVYNPKAQRACGLQLVSLDRSVERDASAQPDLWREWLAEDNRTTPGDEAAFRLDFAAWLDCLPARKKEMAGLLAQGFGTAEVATLLEVTPAAVSIARTWLERSWHVYQGEPVQEDNPSVRRPVGRPRREDRFAPRGRQRARTVVRELVEMS
jgi:hypothetical protein